MASENDELLLGDVCALLWTERRFILVVLALFIAVGIVYTVVVPARYQAKATIVMPALQASGVPSLAQSLGIVAQPGDTTLSTYRKLLESERLVGFVSSKCGISRHDLRELRVIEDDAKSNSIDISFASRDPQLALRVVSAYLEGLRSLNQVLSLSPRAKRVRLLDSTLAERRLELSQAEARLEKFDEGAVTAPSLDPTSLARSVGGAVSSPFRYRQRLTDLQIELDKLNGMLAGVEQKSIAGGSQNAPDFPPVAAWRTELADLDLRVEAARAVHPEDSPEVQQLLKQRQGVEALVQRDVTNYLAAVRARVVGASSTLDENRLSVLKQIDAVRQLTITAPHESTQYQRLVRGVVIAASIVTQMNLDLEQAKIDMDTDPNRWEVLDEPALAEKPVNKNYFRNCFLCLAIGLILALPFAFRRATSPGAGDAYSRLSAQQ